MKIIVMNGSPLMDKGNTALLLNPFLEGMREFGAEIEIYYTKKLNIKPCQGEYNCQFKTPGRCFQKDDMDVLLPKLAAADIQVFATPVYVDGVSGPMKNLWDRMVPLVHLSFELREGRCCHPLREGNNPGKVVLVASCGFWELDNFEPLLAHTKAMARSGNRKFAGALLRPHASTLKAMISAGVPIDDLLDAAREAGRQLVRDGGMSEHTLAAISHPLVPLDRFIRQANQAYDQALTAFSEP